MSRTATDSREQAHDDMRTNQFDQRIDIAEIDFEENLYDLEKLPKIDGWVFMWGRVSMHGQPDLKNLQSLRNKNWQPVIMEDLKEKALAQGKDVSFLLETSLNGQKGLVGTHDMVLFTRPAKVHDMYKAQRDKITAEQEKNVQTEYENAVPDQFKQSGKWPVIDD